MSVHTIHHVTAVTAQIGRNLEFYTGVLGLRLVKRSVNQDDVRAYHLFYADKVGTPGTDMTFFDWPDIGPNVPGPGTIGRTTFRARAEALDWWQERLLAAGCEIQAGEDEMGRRNVRFTDFEGQRLELVDDTGLPEQALVWDEVVPADRALRGIMGVDIHSGRPDATRAVLTDLLGFSASDRSQSVYETGDDDRYGHVRLVGDSGSRLGRVGAGGVHHVAMRVAGEEELLAMQKRIEAAGHHTSGKVDRFYFMSLYFREPGGVLFELATDGPGFSADEDEATLGERLALPPLLEPRRREIEAGLKPLPQPAGAR